MYNRLFTARWTDDFLLINHAMEYENKKNNGAINDSLPVWEVICTKLEFGMAG